MTNELTTTDLANLAHALRRQAVITERRIVRLTEHTPDSPSLPMLKRRLTEQQALLLKVGRLVREA